MMCLAVIDKNTLGTSTGTVQAQWRYPSKERQRTKAIAVFLVCNLRPVFEKIKLDVRLSLKPFKDFDGSFDPSSTALTKCSQTLSNGTCVFRILGASV